MKAKLTVLAATAFLVALPATTAHALAPSLVLAKNAKLDKTDGSATIGATVNQVGGLTLRDPNGVQVKAFHVDTTGAGTYVLDITPKRAIKRKLNKNGEAKIKIAVTFGLIKAPDPYTEGEVYQTKVITLKKN